MPTTTNFGWTTPADTDLVKDGALAIRTLGNGIDTSFLDLKGGTTNQVLAKNSNTDLDFKWVTPAATGKVLQVVATFKSDPFTSTAATFADITGLSASITPSSTASKILILSNINMGGTTAVNGSGARLVRGATAIGIATDTGSRAALSISATVGGDDDYVGSYSFVYLDSPATTSSTTYKWQTYEAGGTTFVNRGQADSNSSSQFRTASNIILLEIGA